MVFLNSAEISQSKKGFNFCHTSIKIRKTLRNNLNRQYLLKSIFTSTSKITNQNMMIVEDIVIETTIYYFTMIGQSVLTNQSLFKIKYKYLDG